MSVEGSQTYAVYFKSRVMTGGMDDVTKEFLKERLDLELRVCMKALSSTFAIH